jgi:hypothetical protein
MTLFSKCLEHSFIPAQWKNANITPIPKVHNPSTYHDYRGINLTSTLCKIQERIIAQYILKNTSHLFANNKQYGFLPKRSTMDAVIQVIEAWSHAKDVKDDILAIFFDFAKAFDLVQHRRMLEKFESKGYLPSWLISWLAAYLHNRKQRAVVGQIKTEWKPVEAGVIQGSVLGPIPFLLFILDVNEYFPKGTDLLKYADDILTYLLAKAIHSELPQEKVDGIVRWCRDNDMRLNIGKCKVLVVPHWYHLS